MVVRAKKVVSTMFPSRMMATMDPGEYSSTGEERGSQEVPQKIRASGCPRAELEEKLKFYKWVNCLLNEHRGVRVSGHPKISFPDIMVIVSPNVKF